MLRGLACTAAAAALAGCATTSGHLGAAASPSAASPAAASTATRTIAADALPVCGTLPVSNGPSRRIIQVTLTGPHTVRSGSAFSLGVVAQSLTSATQTLMTGSSVDVLIVRAGKVVGRDADGAAPDGVGRVRVNKPLVLTAPGSIRVSPPAVLASGCARGPVNLDAPNATRVGLPPGRYTLIGVLTDSPRGSKVPVLDTVPFGLTVTPARTPVTAPTVVRVAVGSASARTMCESALGPVGTATLTTVGDIRDLRIGPDAAPAPHAFPNAPRGAVAAWCWIRDAARRLDVAWAVSPGAPAQGVGGVGWLPGATPPPIPAGEPIEP